MSWTETRVAVILSTFRASVLEPHPQRCLLQPSHSFIPLVPPAEQVPFCILLQYSFYYLMYPITMCPAFSHRVSHIAHAVLELSIFLHQLPGRYNHRL